MRMIAETTKQAIIKKALNNKSQTIGEIALENNIGRTTLNRWLLDMFWSSKIRHIFLEK